MVCKKVLLQLGVTGSVMLVGGILTSFGTLAATEGVYTAGPVALMASGVVVSSLGYAFLYLVHHLKKTDRFKNSEPSRACFG